MIISFRKRTARARKRIAKSAMAPSNQTERYSPSACAMTKNRTEWNRTAKPKRLDEPDTLDSMPIAPRRRNAMARTSTRRVSDSRQVLAHPCAGSMPDSRLFSNSIFPFHFHGYNHRPRYRGTPGSCTTPPVTPSHSLLIAELPSTLRPAPLHHPLYPLLSPPSFRLGAPL